MLKILYAFCSSAENSHSPKNTIFESNKIRFKAAQRTNQKKSLIRILNLALYEKKIKFVYKSFHKIFQQDVVFRRLFRE